MEVDQIKRIAVVGAGLMGHGIAQEFALAGYQVRLHSRRQESLDQALDNIQANLERLTRLGLVESGQAAGLTARIHPTTLLEEAAGEADVVFESVHEDLTLKQRIFRALDARCPARTILASNTSSLMPTAFAAATRRPDKVLVAHYANPPYLIPLVEIVRGQKTSDTTVSTLCALLEKLGKRPIVMHREAPGFIANRLQMALLREALEIVRQGLARPQDVDAVLATSIGRRWAVAGVFEVLELAGWDLVEDIASGLFPHLSTASEPPLLREKVERGALGVKSGAGFYQWTPEAAEALRRRIAAALIHIEQWQEEPPPRPSEESNEAG